MKPLVRIFVSLSAVCLLAGCSSRKATAPSAGYSVPSAQEAVMLGNNPPLQKLIDEARLWIGTRYTYGGHSRSGTDCSGMVMELFLKVFDMKLPRSSAEQQKFCTPVKQTEIMPGDLIFFATGRDASKVSHVGLYTGGGRMIHASASRGVVEDGVSAPYFTRHFHSAGRVVASLTPAKSPEQPAESQADMLNEAIEERIDSIYTSIID